MPDLSGATLVSESNVERVWRLPSGEVHIEWLHQAMPVTTVPDEDHEAAADPSTYSLPANVVDQPRLVLIPEPRRRRRRKLSKRARADLRALACGTLGATIAEIARVLL